jgi:signal transduction histidine kinase/DNA-binding NarL/FixJ family response regulator
LALSRTQQREETTGRDLPVPRPNLLAPPRVIFRASAVAWALASALALAFTTPVEAGAALVAALVMLASDRLHPGHGTVAVHLATFASLLAAVIASWNTGGLTSPFLVLGLPGLLSATQTSGRTASTAWGVGGAGLLVALLVHEHRPLVESLALCASSLAAATTMVLWILQHRRLLEGEQARADNRAERAEALARKLETARAAERAAAQNRANFYAVMSHELRTPLGGLVGLSAVLESTSLDASQREIVRNMRASAEALRLLVNDVLDLEALERGVLRLEKSAFSFRDLAGDLAILFRPTAASKGIELRVDVADDVPQALDGDALRLRQVISNLVSNAIKFTENGAVELRVRWSDERSSVIISVIDSGVGIPAADIARVFAPFEQTGPRRAGGTGLGLSIVKHLVDCMGGKVSLASELGRGSTFEITLPLAVLEQLDEPEESAPIRGHASFRGVRALVVDDDEINRFTTRLLLERLGVVAEAAATAEQALAALEAGRFTLAFLDMNMPGTSGPELARAILARPKPHPYLVALTASTSERDRQAALEAGLRDYLHKPIETSRLEQVIRDAMAHFGMAPARRTLVTRDGNGTAPRNSAVPPETLELRRIGELVSLLPEGEGAALVEDALVQVRSQLGEIEGAASRGDDAALNKLAHKLKGTSGTMGFAALSAAAERLEQDVSALPAVQRAMDSTERAARAYLQTLPRAAEPAGPQLPV